MMLLFSFMREVGHQEANFYLLADELSHAALLVDAGGYAPELVAATERHGLNLNQILLTHLHEDHVAALPQYLELWPHAQVLAPAPLALAPRALPVRPGQVIQAGPFRLRVLRTSGHTPESVSFYCAEAGLCFVGDALFAGSVGGTSDDRRHQEEVTNLRTEILSLPDTTELYSGHGPLTTVAIERRANPFLQPGFGRT